MKKMVDEETIRLRKEKKELDTLLSFDRPRPWYNQKESKWEVEY